jgi:UDP-glucose 4-epimerase
MRVLITGGAGFIGSNLATHLLTKEHQVTAFDHSAAKAKRVPKGCAFIGGDVTDQAAVATAVSGHDAVVHLAAMVSVPETMEQPGLAEQVNVIGTINVLAAAKAAGVKKVILASSAAVYGEEPRTPTGEEERPRPMSPYAVTKLTMEDYAQLYAHQGLPTVCLRLFNVYGPGQDPKSRYAAAIPAFINRALKGETLTIYGDGEQTRDFVYVGDVCRAFELALAKGAGCINVASGRSVTINEVARNIVSLMKSKSTVVHAPARSGDPRKSLADVSKAKRELGFIASTQFSEGLKKTIEYVRKQ